MEPLGSGVVNDTWLITLQSDKKYVLQRLNSAVFPDPGLVQENLRKVTDHLQARLAHLKYASEQTDTDFTIFQPVKNDAGDISYKDSNGAWWRLLTCIDDSRSLQLITTTHQAEKIGATLGLFHRLISTLPPASLADPLPGFHNTPLYLEQYDILLPAVLNPEAEDCRDVIHQRRGDVFLLENARKRASISQQVIHGDPKVANFLFSMDTNRVLSLIDLDTVKPGLLLHDLGDCLRSCCNPLGESIKNVEHIVFDKNLFAAVLQGYLSRAADLLTPEDRRLIVDSVRLISFELGVRFYSDYLVNNCYFKVEYPGQNLFRARVQFALVRSIEEQYCDLASIVKSIVKSE
ncbi:MAG: aminoglycoside phosphotransferase family protein [Candidatus Electrothrix sp. AR4]|nr:aminoglycoside phosphotransferase family protein [Candidatus Electrothrix sp. AR4]